MRRSFKLAPLAVVALFVSGCATHQRIGRILADPMHFRRDVTVEGRVTGSVGAFVAGGYRVDDGTGSIIVLSNRGVPPTGSRVKVRGTVTPGVALMGRSLGTTLHEHSHKVYW